MTTTTDQGTLYPDLPPGEGGVYYMTDGIRIKIGWTSRPPRHRGGELDTDVLFFIPEGQTTEGREHRRWASARIGNTEWFELTYGLLAEIARNVNIDDWAAMNALNCLIMNHSQQRAA